MKTRWSLRVRLLAWNITAMAVILALFISLMTWMIRGHVAERIDAEMAEEAKELAEEIQSQPSLEAFQTRFDRFYAEHGGFSFDVSRLDGTVLCGSPWLRAYELPRLGGHETRAAFQEMSLGQIGPHRVLTRIVAGPTEPLLLHVITPSRQYSHELAAFFWMLFWSGLISLIAACIAGVLVTRHVLEPLARMTSAAERISSENLTLSIQVDNQDDEVGRLANTLNQTFERLRLSLDRIRRFTSDAAHELRTPLAVMQTEAEVALRNGAHPEELRNAMETVLEQALQLTRLIDQLLTLSRHDTSERAPQFDEVFLKPLLHDVVSSVKPRAEQKRILLNSGTIPDCVLCGDDISLGRLFLNLLDNAIKYTPAGGTVTLSAECDSSSVRVKVTDTGVGIDPVHWSRLFDRFYRVNSSRQFHPEGVGLGLAICHSITDLHHGKISVRSEPGHGTTFTVVLPLITDAQTAHQWELAAHG